MTTYSIGILLSQFGTNPLFHVWFLLLLLDPYRFFRRQGRTWYSHLFKEFSSLLWPTPSNTRIVNDADVDFFFWNYLAFSMIQQVLAIWSLVPLPFLNPAYTSGRSQFTYCWSLVWRILSISLLACEMSAIVQWFEHSLALLFFGTGMKTDLFQSYGHCWVFQICWQTESSTLTPSSLGLEIAQLEFHHLH